MNLILFDPAHRAQLYPFTYVRPVADIRIGMVTIREWWEHHLQTKANIDTVHWLQSSSLHTTGDYCYINAAVVPASDLTDAIKALQTKEVLISEQTIIAFKSSDPIEQPGRMLSKELATKGFSLCQFKNDMRLLSRPWHIFEHNDWAIRQQFSALTDGRTSQPVSEGCSVLNAQDIFIEASARILFSTLNASTGPIYIGKDVQIMEGCSIRGPFVMGEGSVLKMGSRVYGATTLGPYCTGGGEIKNSVLMGYSNKGHEGYLGDSVLGEWCNLGAGTSCSNLKNTVSEVRVWSPDSNTWVGAGLKCGLLMGDYARSAINTSFNTGSVVGVASHVFGNGRPSKYTPNFSWGQEEGNRYGLEKALLDIENWKKLKNQSLSESEKQILQHIFDHH